MFDVFIILSYTLWMYVFILSNEHLHVNMRCRGLRSRDTFHMQLPFGESLWSHAGYCLSQAESEAVASRDVLTRGECCGGLQNTEMPHTERQRGGVAAATSFYGNRAAGAASAGLKQRKKERSSSWGSLPPRSKSSSDLEAGFKSPRSVALWQQRKLEMAGMVTVVKRWDDTNHLWEKTVTTPVPPPRRDFTKISPYEIQKFEQWHDRHPHLYYPREIPDPMFYRKTGKGPLPVRDDKGVPTARAYGGRHVKKLPGLIPPKTTSKANSYSLSKSSPQVQLVKPPTR